MLASTHVTVFSGFCTSLARQGVFLQLDSSDTRIGASDSSLGAFWPQFPQNKVCLLLERFRKEELRSSQAEMKEQQR